MDRLSLELRAYDGLRELLSLAGRVRMEFAAAGLEIPAPLARLLGEDRPSEQRSGWPTATETQKPKTLLSFDAGHSSGIPDSEEDPDANLAQADEESPPPPPQAKADWIWVDAKDAGVQSLALALLNQTGGTPISAAVIYAGVREYLPEASRGAVYNTLMRLPHLLEKKDEGWVLQRPDEAPVLHGNYVWGTAENLGKNGVAEYRRTRLIQLLRRHPGGVTMTSALHLLVEDPQTSAGEISRDMVKADLQRLAAEKRVEFDEVHKKWRAPSQIQGVP